MLNRGYQRGRYCNIRLRECSETETNNSLLFRMKKKKKEKKKERKMNNWLAKCRQGGNWQRGTKSDKDGRDLSQWNKYSFFGVYSFIKVSWLRPGSAATQPQCKRVSLFRGWAVAKPPSLEANIVRKHYKPEIVWQMAGYIRKQSEVSKQHLRRRPYRYHTL